MSALNKRGADFPATIWRLEEKVLAFFSQVAIVVLLLEKEMFPLEFIISTLFPARKSSTKDVDVGVRASEIQAK